MTNEQVLSSIYYNPQNPASFGGIHKLYRAAKEQSPSITYKTVREWLKSQITYTLHKPIRRNFRRNPVIVSSIDEQWQADLVDMQEFKATNNNFRFILTVIDIFSKYAWAIPLKTKTGKDVTDAFSKIFAERVPFRLQTDQGTEFKNSILRKLLKEKNVHFFTSQNDEIKCSVVERFNRTLKSKMWKYFTSKGTRRYVDILPQLVVSYNSSKHRTIKMKPVEVSQENSSTVFENTYGAKSVRELNQRLQPVAVPKSDPVRVKYKLKPFDKGYYPLWTDAIYKISSVNTAQDKAMYTLEDEHGETQKRRYYPEEVQSVNTTMFRVEKILARRKRKGRVEYLIKWLNHPETYNSWEPAENVKTL